MNKNIPQVYAVILNYNGFEDTKNCVKSFKKVDYKNFKIVVVDNSSTDGSYEKLQVEFPDITVIKTEYNSGYTGGMNAGAKYAINNNADYVLLSNNDMLYESDFLTILVNKIESDNTIGIISPKVLYMHDPQIIYCAGADFKLSHCGSENLYQGKSAGNFGNEPKEITNAEGSCLLIRKEVFEKAGYYNENYFIYFEDIDFSDRVRKYYKIFYEPKSLVYHKAGSGLSWKDYSPFYYYYYTRNRLVYFSKYNAIMKIYAIIFSVCNSSAKSLILIKEYILNKVKRERTGRAIKSIWEGTFIGLKVIFGFIKIEDNSLLVVNKSYQYRT